MQFYRSVLSLRSFIISVASVLISTVSMPALADAPTGYIQDSTASGGTSVVNCSLTNNKCYGAMTAQDFIWTGGHSKALYHHRRPS